MSLQTPLKLRSDSLSELQNSCKEELQRHLKSSLDGRRMARPPAAQPGSPAWRTLEAPCQALSEYLWLSVENTVGASSVTVPCLWLKLFKCLTWQEALKSHHRPPHPQLQTLLVKSMDPQGSMASARSPEIWPMRRPFILRHASGNQRHLALQVADNS